MAAPSLLLLLLHRHRYGSSGRFLEIIIAVAVRQR
jgi:hypothetical protein